MFIENSSEIIFPDEVNRFLICTSCVFLSSKTSNQLIKIEKLIKILIPLMTHVNLKEEELESLLLNWEFEILNSIGFDLEVSLPYPHLFKLRPILEGCPESFLKYCIWFINDSFTLPVCLFFSPEVIAKASILLLREKVKLKIDVSSLFNSEVQKAADIISLIYNKSSLSKVNKLPNNL
jgi:hypothetical protein